MLFVEDGLKVNSAGYIEVLAENVVPWVTETYGTHYIFTHDGAAAHTANKTQQWCKDHFCSFSDKELWPPSSPDINRMDFGIWSILDSEVSSVWRGSVPALRAALDAAWSHLDPEVVRRASASVTSRLRAVIRAKGGNEER